MRILLLGFVSALILACGGNADVPLSPSSPAAPVIVSLRGVVTDETGMPIGGAFVGIMPNPNTTHPSTVTNAQGEYRLDGLQKGTLTVRATAFRRAEVVTQVIADGVTPFNVRMPLLPRVTLSGVVSDIDTGVPIPDATVRFLEAPGSLDNAGFAAVSGADGRYRFDAVFPSNSNLAVTAPGYQEWRFGMRITGDTTLGLPLRANMLEITGQVGGAPSTWTCVTKVGLSDAPCQQYPFKPRRIPSTATARITWGETQGLVLVYIISLSSGQASFATAPPGTTRTLETTANLIVAGDYAVRVVKQTQIEVPATFTLTYSVSD